MKESNGRVDSSKAHNVVILDESRRNIYYPEREVFGNFQRFNVTILTSFEGIMRKLKSRVRVVAPRTINLLPVNLISYNFIFVRAIQKLLKTYEPSVVVTYELYSTLSYQITRVKKQLKFIQAVICYDTIPMNTALWGIFLPTRFFALSVIDGADIFIALNNRIKDALMSSGVQKEKIHTIYPGIFIEDYSIHNIERKSNGLNFKFLFVGALRLNKGIKTLLSVFISLNKEGYGNIELVIAGSGPLEQEVKEASRENKNIHFAGYVSEDKKKQLLYESDAFVYPSEDVFVFSKIKRWEEQSALSVCEAMAAGLPIIVSDSGGLPEIIGSKEAVFRQGCIECLKEKILELYHSPELRVRLALYNAERSRKLFDVRVYSECLESIFLDSMKYSEPNKI